MKLNTRTHLFKLLLICFFIIFILGCSKSIRISQFKFFLVTKNSNREPNILFKHKVERYFNKWYADSKPITNEGLQKLDSLSHLGYEIYQNFMSDSVLLEELSIIEKYEYVLVPNKLKISAFSGLNIDSCLISDFFEVSKNHQQVTIEITDFRPQIKHRKCLYFKDRYTNNLYRFSAKYGVKPFILIDSPLMYGGFRFLETSPLVNEIKIFKDSKIVSIVYSLHTSDFESFFKYENNKMIFIKHRHEMAVD